MKKIRLFLLFFIALIPSYAVGMCSHPHGPLRLENLTLRNIGSLLATRKAVAALGIIGSLLWVEKCEYRAERNRVTFDTISNGYAHKNPIKHTWHVMRDVVLGASHRNWIHNHFTDFGYQPAYGLVGSTWSGIKHTVSGLHEVRRVKEEIEYWLNWFRNLNLR